MESFIHITGSVPSTDGPSVADLVERTVYETARELLRNEIGLVALVGASTNNATASFDRVIIKAAADHLVVTGEQGIILWTVRHRTKWAERIDAETQERLTQLRRHINDESLPDDDYTGGNIRAAQAGLSDGAIIIGGGRGVKHTADLMAWPESGPAGEPSPPKPLDEIFVAGLSGGLPEDIRYRIDEGRGWNANADNRTVVNADDCARVAHWVAGQMRERLKASAAGGGNSLEPQASGNPVAPKRKIWYLVGSSTLAIWCGNAINAIFRALGLGNEG